MEMSLKTRQMSTAKHLPIQPAACSSRLTDAEDNELECWQLTCQLPNRQSPARSSFDQRIRIQRERPTDVGVHWKQIILYTKALFPGRVQMIPKTYPSIKQRVASCHTAEVISNQSLPAPTPHMKRTTDLTGGSRTPAIFGMDVLT